MRQNSNVEEEVFTLAWAYDQIWASLRWYAGQIAGTYDEGKEQFQFRQTGRKPTGPDDGYGFNITGFTFGPTHAKPVFAIVMRSVGEYDKEADELIRSEIAAFFDDGVQVAWDVDVLHDRAIRVYRAANPGYPIVYHMGEVAEAEPALPGWKLPLSELSYHRDEGILATTALVNPALAIRTLASIPGKAEIIRGNIVHFSQAGGFSGWAGDQIFSSLHDYCKKTKLGIAVGDNKAFLVDLPGRKSFSPTVALYIGRMHAGFYYGEPRFAVEVRNGLDYSNDGEGRISAKIADYFAAGTEVVWDVDVLRYEFVRVFHKDNPDQPTVYRRGDLAEAEPAVPGWRMPADDLFYQQYDTEDDVVEK